MENKKVGLTSGNSMKEIIDDLRKDCGMPNDDLIIILHIPRKDLDKLTGALELVGYEGKVGAMRKADRA